ncbi:hypothetical protein MMC11_007902 [Xylographa trunciseda]|nr:hypothetical protein [Xylographa trunciseda]
MSHVSSISFAPNEAFDGNNDAWLDMVNQSEVVVDALQNTMSRMLPEVSPNQSALARSTATSQESSHPPAFLDYEPKPFLPEDLKNYCYRTYLDRLGFKKWDDPDANEVRLQFIRDLKAHVYVPETTYLCKEDNPPAFHALIFGFFEKYGERYWGREREHLAEKDPVKGFLYPRDALREDSRLIRVMEDVFNYKAKCSKNNDGNRPLDRQVVPHINFSTLSPQDINSIGRESADTNIEGSLRELERARKQETTRSPISSELATTDTDEEDLSNAAIKDNKSDQPQRRVLPPRSTRSKISYDLAQLLHDTEEAGVGDLHVIRSILKQQVTNNREPPVIAPSHTKDILTLTPVAKLTAKRTPSTVPNRSHRKALVSHGIKRKDPLESIESVRKRARLAHDSPLITTSQSAPPITIHNSPPKKSRGSSNGAHGHSKSSMAGKGVRRPNGRSNAAECADQDNTFVTLSDDSDSAEVTYQSSRDTGLSTPTSNKIKAEAKIKAEQLSDEIMSKTTLLVTATNLPDMAPVTVKLECYKGFHNFLDFLAEECVLDNFSSKVTDVSATYTWSGRKHRLRKERFDVDWQAFCNELRDAFQKNPTFMKQGCEVGMLLHVAA